MSINERNPRLTVYFPESLKRDLLQMAEETGLSQTQIVVIATHSLLSNYKIKGSFIFSDITIKKEI